MITAEAWPCAVTVTRSCWLFTRLTTADRCVLTSARGIVGIVTSLTSRGERFNGRAE